MLVFWILFNLFVLAMLALDLGALNRRPQSVSVRRALVWSGLWIALAAAFAVLEFLWQGRAPALQFVTGYVIELMLSVDNLFVFLLIFRYFKVPGEYQHKVLVGGILGALLMRGAFIGAGVGLVRRFRWITYGLGALLVYSGAKLLRPAQADIRPEKNPVLRMLRRVLPVTEDYVNGRFFTRRQGLYATPLLVALLVVESSDLLLAMDSIPAVLGITLNPFIIYTSNVFAILGLRSMYFALAGMLDLFYYLHYGLSAVLILVGLKMLGSHYVNISTEWTLATVLCLLGASILASLLNPKRKSAE